MAADNAMEWTGIGLVKLSARATTSASSHNEKLSSLNWRNFEHEILAGAHKF